MSEYATVTVTLQADLAEKLGSLAVQQNTTPDEIFAAALGRYLRQVQEQKIRQEARYFRGMHSELVKQYLGQVVAIHQGQVVDHDMDFAALHQRVRKKFGQMAVLLRRVEAEPERVLMFRSPHLERGEE